MVNTVLFICMSQRTAGYSNREKHPRPGSSGICHSVITCKWISHIQVISITTSHFTDSDLNFVPGSTVLRPVEAVRSKNFKPKAYVNTFGLEDSSLLLRHDLNIATERSTLSGSTGVLVVRISRVPFQGSSSREGTLHLPCTTSSEVQRGRRKKSQFQDPDPWDRSCDVSP